MASARINVLMHRLHRRCLALQEQQRQLQGEQQQACFNLVLLHALCQTLNTYNIRRGIPQADRTSSLEDLAQAAAAEEWGLELEPGRTAPRNDPLALFKLLLTEELECTEQNTTAAGLANLLRESVFQGSVYGHHKRTGMIDAAEHDRRMFKLWFRFVHALLTAAMDGRPQLLFEVTVYNLATLQRDPQAAEQGTEHSKAVVPFLDLSPLQMQDIAAGNALFARLCSNIRQQYQQLQAAATTSTAPASDSGAGSGAACMGTQLGQQQSPQELQQRARETERMQALVQKESALKAAGCAFVMGCLTWEQLVHGSVITYPYPLRLPVVMEEVARLHQQQ